MHRIPLIGMIFLATLVVAAPARAQEPDAFWTRAIEILDTADHPWLQAHDLHAEADALRTLYAGRAGTPLWERSGAVTEPAVWLLQKLQAATDEGLDPADYEADRLARQLDDLRSRSDATPADWADWDVALSTVALRFVRHLHYGRIDPALAGFDLNALRPAIDLPATLQQLADGNDPAGTIAAIEPQFHHYRLLKAALAKYRQLAADDHWAGLPDLDRKSVKPGEPYPGAALLRERLVMLGDLLPEEPAPAEDALLDEALAAGLRRFQERHGLTEDGVLGKRTLEALNTPLAFRVRQIELCLERWRWLPESAAPSIIVNIPQFRLFAFRSDDDREDGMLDMEVVVGQAFPEKRTPIFLATLRTVVFRPYWDVPPSIARKEILPEMRREADYLRSHHMELVAGQRDESPVVPPTAENIALVESGKVRVRQVPGPDNALGEIKFLLPNPHNVYLHATPAHALFQRAQRAFSHGCIRVSDPASLAAYVLRNEPDGWPPERIAAAMQGPPNQRVTLGQPIQVMILYGTTVATETGRVFFLDDVYGHDQVLERLLSALPGADGTGVDVHEVGPGVEPDAPASEAQGQVMQLRR